MRKLLHKLHDYSTVILIFIVVACICIMLIYVSSLYRNSILEQEALKNEVMRLQERKNAIESMKALTDNQIDEYIELFSYIIPEKEDFFSIIYALEKISQKSKFKIVNYTIRMTATQNNKIALNIDGSGNIDTFTAFLENYMFAGGRLATIEKIEFSEKKLNAARLAINFYAQSGITGSQKTKKMTQKDIDYLKLVRSKITFDMKDQTEELDYPIKNDPFN